MIAPFRLVQSTSVPPHFSIRQGDIVMYVLKCIQMKQGTQKDRNEFAPVLN